ncbi:MAG: trigger factor [Dehalococcoidia bacterium]
MKVTVERLPESRVQLEVEVDPESIEKTLEATYKKVAAKAQIAGFRPGKAPRPLVMQRLGGRSGLIREALDEIVPDAYNTAIEEQDVDAIDQPSLEILEIEPVRFKATVPVRPTVELGDYKTVAVAPETSDVTDEEVDEEVLAIRRRLAIHVPADRPVQWNDILIADIKGSVDDEPFIQDEAAEFRLAEGSPLLTEGLAEAFLGMGREETKEIELTLPDDFQAENLRSKTARFELLVREVKEEELPEEDDELAAEVGEDIETLEELRDRIRENLAANKEAGEKTRRRNEAIKQLTEISDLDYPQVLVEREIDHMVSEGVGNDAARYKSYLQAIGRSHEDFRETFRESAEERVRASLVLARLAEIEEIKVSDEEVQAEIGEIAGPMGDDSEQFQQIFRNDQARESIRRNLETQRTFDRLVEIAIANAPAESEPAPESKPSRSKKAADTENTETTEEAAPDTEKRPRSRKKKESAE